MTLQKAVYSKLCILTVTAHAMIGKKEVKLEVRKKESKNSFVCFVHFVVNFRDFFFVCNTLLFCCYSGKKYHDPWPDEAESDCCCMIWIEMSLTVTVNEQQAIGHLAYRFPQSVGNRTMLNTCRVRELLEVRVVQDERGSIIEIV